MWQDCDIQACATDGELIISVQGIWRAPSEFSICVRLCLFSVWGIGFILAGDILLLVVPFYSASCRYHSSGQHGGIRYVSLGVFCDRSVEVGGINDNSMIQLEGGGGGGLVSRLDAQPRTVHIYHFLLLTHQRMVCQKRKISKCQRLF